MVIVIPTSIAAALVTQCTAFFCYFKALGNPYRLTILIQKKLLSNMYASIKVSTYKKDEFQILQLESYLHIQTLLKQ